MQKIYDLGKDNLTTEEIKNMLLLAQTEKIIPPGTRHQICGVFKAFCRKYSNWLNSNHR
jgi:hypothetical protein